MQENIRILAEREVTRGRVDADAEGAGGERHHGRRRRDRRSLVAAAPREGRDREREERERKAMVTAGFQGDGEAIKGSDGGTRARPPRHRETDGWVRR